MDLGFKTLLVGKGDGGAPGGVLVNPLFQKGLGGARGEGGEGGESGGPP